MLAECPKPPKIVTRFQVISVGFGHLAAIYFSAIKGHYRTIAVIRG